MYDCDDCVCVCVSVSHSFHLCSFSPYIFYRIQHVRLDFPSIKTLRLEGGQMDISSHNKNRMIFWVRYAHLLIEHNIITSCLLLCDIQKYYNKKKEPSEPNNIEQNMTLLTASKSNFFLGIHIIHTWTTIKQFCCCCCCRSSCCCFWWWCCCQRF